MTGYTETKETMDAYEAYETLLEIRDDLGGVAGLLQYATEADSGITNAALAVLHDVVLAAHKSLSVIATILEPDENRA